MIGGKYYNQPDHKQRYQGQQNQSGRREKSIWRCFLETMMPWLKYKWEQGERYLEAKVQHEEAQAFEKVSLAEAHQADKRLKDAQAAEIQMRIERKMSDITNRAKAIEQQRLERIGSPGISLPKKDELDDSPNNVSTEED